MANDIGNGSRKYTELRTMRLVYADAAPSANDILRLVLNWC